MSVAVPRPTFSTAVMRGLRPAQANNVDEIRKRAAARERQRSRVCRSVIPSISMTKKRRHYESRFRRPKYDESGLATGPLICGKSIQYSADRRLVVQRTEGF